MSKMIGLFGAIVVPFDTKKPSKVDGHAAPVGGGPPGKTCRSCAHIVSLSHGGKSWRKCELMKRFWTHGLGTDIRSKDEACKFWVYK
jgi:hypothetical protein